MTLNRLVCACVNMLTGSTTLEIVSTIGENLYCGLYNDGCIKDFGKLEVRQFAIGELKYGGVAKVMTVWVDKESTNE